MNDFQPRFIQESEFASFGLPDATQQPGIVGLVERASTLIDESCGRVDTDGNGSLVYTTYQERILTPVGRNVFRIAFRPLTALDVNTVASLAASGSNGVQPNFYYTGAVANNVYVGAPLGTNQLASTTLSPIISASGRYSYARRSQQQVYPDLNYAANVLQIASFFGGPPQFTAIDVSMCDFDPRTGEIWVPAGLYLSQYTEVWITYNSGFHPLHLPRAIKHACASLVHNFMSRGGGATGLKSFQSGRISASFNLELIDPTIDAMLQPYRTVRAV